MQKRLFSFLDKRLSAPYRLAPVLGRGEYAAHPDITMRYFGEAETIHYPEPHHCQPLPLEFLNMLGTVNYPQPFVLEIAEGELHGRHALATTAKGEIILEALLNHRPYLDSVSAGRIHYPKSFGQFWRQISARPRYEKVFVLANQFGNAYFHWMLECLPRLWLYQQLSEAIPVLIEANPPHYVRETLALLGIQNIIEWDVSAAKAAHLFIPMALHGTGIPSPLALSRLAEILLAKSDLPQIDAPRVYISRQNTKKRRVVNETAVRQFLAERGFQTFILEELSLAQQMALFRQAQVVVGAHGAGFSNAIFSQKLKLLEFFEPSYLNACYYRLAAGMGFDYGLLLGDSVGLDIKLDLDLLETMLRQLGI